MTKYRMLFKVIVRNFAAILAKWRLNIVYQSFISMSVTFARIGSGSGLLSDETKQLSEAIMIYQWLDVAHLNALSLEIGHKISFEYHIV